MSTHHSYRPGVLPEGDDTQCENGHNGMLSQSPVNHCFDAGTLIFDLWSDPLIRRQFLVLRVFFFNVFF